MRNLLIGAVSAMALFAGSAVAADYPSSTTDANSGSVVVAPGTSGATNWSGTTTVPSGSAGMSDTTTTNTMSGTSTDRRTRSVTPESANRGTMAPALESQRATGTHCPPGTPNCRPGNLGGK